MAPSFAVLPSFRRVLPLLLLVILWWPAPLVIAESAGDQSLDERVNGLFKGFTAYIERQVQADKKEFLQAQICTEWFYKQRRPKPPSPSAKPIAYEATECEHRFPEGLVSARNELTRTQSSLSVSLTFYEFALVGDRNDDGRYNDVELQDMLTAFGLASGGILPPHMLLGTLNDTFDTIRKGGGLDALMTSMGSLYDKGYRFTTQDRMAMDKVMG
jgi:hypothetical protein